MRLGLAVFLTFVVAVALPETVAGQTPERAPATTFRELSGVLAPGLRVEATTARGARLRGRIDSVDVTLLHLLIDGRVHDFDEASIREVRRQGDRLWNGALLGAGAGFLVAGLADAMGDPSCSGDEAGFCFVFMGTVVGIPVGILVGALIDASMSHDEVLYARQAQASRWMAVPLLSPHRYGLTVAKVF